MLAAAHPVLKMASPALMGHARIATLRDSVHLPPVLVPCFTLLGAGNPQHCPRHQKSRLHDVWPAYDESRRVGTQSTYLIATAYAG